MTTITKYTVTATIPAGETTAEAYFNSVRGKILAVGINYDSNTCTVDLDSDGEASDQKILDLAAANTDVTIYPRTVVQDNTGTDIDLSDGQGGNTAQYEHYIVYGRVKVSLASGTAEESVTVDLIVEEN